VKHEPGDVHPERNPVVRLFQRIVPVVSDYRGARFLVRENGRLAATPLALVLVAIEASDLVFALDSIPAVLAVTTDPLIVYTSNVFAILGLRSLFFVLAGVLGRFEKLHVGLAFVLMFVGVKMVANEWAPVPIGISLAVVAVLIGGSVVWSMMRTRSTPLRNAEELVAGGVELARPFDERRVQESDQRQDAPKHGDDLRVEGVAVRK
jgi:tellurite resistance protein TerC